MMATKKREKHKENSQRNQQQNQIKKAQNPKTGQHKTHFLKQRLSGKKDIIRHYFLCTCTHLVQ